MFIDEMARIIIVIFIFGISSTIVRCAVYKCVKCSAIEYAFSTKNSIYAIFFLFQNNTYKSKQYLFKGMKREKKQKKMLQMEQKKRYNKNEKRR